MFGGDDYPFGEVNRGARQAAGRVIDDMYSGRRAQDEYLTRVKGMQANLRDMWGAECGHEHMPHVLDEIGEYGGGCHYYNPKTMKHGKCFNAERCKGAPAMVYDGNGRGGRCQVVEGSKYANLDGLCHAHSNVAENTTFGGASDGGLWKASGVCEGCGANSNPHYKLSGEESEVDDDLLEEF
jgi:hypothetical protein